MDFSKYDPLKQQQPEKQEQNQPWMASSKVILLIEYLRKCSDKGFILYEKDGLPGLTFNPGINANDMKNGRKDAAMNMFGLLMDAAADLIATVKSGTEIPMLQRMTSGPERSSSGAGPPQRS